jgi:CTP:molybdopterin cytidylyltransferase MocA
LTALSVSIHTVGPSLSLSALVQVSLEAAADIAVVTNIDMPQVEFVLTRARALSIANLENLHGLKLEAQSISLVGGSASSSRL